MTMGNMSDRRSMKPQSLSLPYIEQSDHQVWLGDCDPEWKATVTPVFDEDGCSGILLFLPGVTFGTLLKDAATLV